MSILTCFKQRPVSWNFLTVFYQSNGVYSCGTDTNGLNVKNAVTFLQSNSCFYCKLL